MLTLINIYTHRGGARKNSLGGPLKQTINKIFKHKTKVVISPKHEVEIAKFY